MPIYTFRNNETGEVQDIKMTMDELRPFKEEHPELSQVFDHTTVPKIVSGINVKPDAGFRDVLKGIKKANRRSQINTFE